MTLLSLQHWRFNFLTWKVLLCCWPGARLFLTLYIGIAISPAIYNSAIWGSPDCFSSVWWEADLPLCAAFKARS